MANGKSISEILDSVHRDIAEQGSVPITDPKTGVPKKGKIDLEEIGALTDSVFARQWAEPDYEVQPLGEDFDQKPKPFSDPELYRAYMQSEGQQFLNAIGGGILGAIPMAGELLARLPDDVVSMVSDEALYENELADFFKSMREGVSEQMPIYTENQGDFDVNDPAHYANLLKGVIESVGGFALSGGAVVKGLGMVTRAFGMGMRANRIAAGAYKLMNKAKGGTQTIAGMGNAIKGVRGVTDFSKHAVTAFSTNSMEGNLMAAEIQEKMLDEMQPMIDGGYIDQQEAYRIIKNEINDFRLANKAMMISDFLAVRGIVKGWNKTRQSRAFSPLWKSAIKNAPLEAMEEMYQNVHAMEAEHDIRKATGLYTSMSDNVLFRAKEFAMDPQTLAEAAGGFLGGPLQIYGLQGVGRIGDKSHNETKERVRKSLELVDASTKANVDIFAKQLKAIENAKDPGTKELETKKYAKLIKGIADNSFVNGTADALYRNLDEIIDNKEGKSSEDEIYAAKLLKEEALRLENMFIASSLYENADAVYPAMYFLSELEELQGNLSEGERELTDSLQKELNDLANKAGAPDDYQVDINELLSGLNRQGLFRASREEKSKSPKKDDWYSKFLNSVRTKMLPDLTHLFNYKTNIKKVETDYRKHIKNYEKLISSKEQEKAKKQKIKDREKSKIELGEKSKKKKRERSRKIKNIFKNLLKSKRRKKTEKIIAQQEEEAPVKIISTNDGKAVTYKGVIETEGGEKDQENRGRKITDEDIGLFPEIEDMLDQGDRVEVLKEAIDIEGDRKVITVARQDVDGNITTQELVTTAAAQPLKKSKVEEIINSEAFDKTVTDELAKGNTNSVKIARMIAANQIEGEPEVEEIEALIRAVEEKADSINISQEAKGTEIITYEEDEMDLSVDIGFVSNKRKQKELVEKEVGVAKDSARKDNTDDIREKRSLYNKIAFLSRAFNRLFDESGDPLRDSNGRIVRTEYLDRDQIGYNLLNDPELSKPGTEISFRVMEDHETLDTFTDTVVPYQDKLDHEEKTGIKYGYRPIGIFSGDAFVGYMHDVEWVTNPDNYDYLDDITPAFIEDQVNKLMKIRTAIAESENGLNGKITKRTAGSLFWIVSNKSPKKVTSAMPDYAKLTKVIVTRDMGPIDEDGNPVKLRGKSAVYASNVGAVYFIDKSGDYDIVIPIRHSGLTKQVRDTISKAIEIFVRRDEIAEGTAKGLQVLHEQFMEDFGYDLTNMRDEDSIAGNKKGLVSFIRQFTAVNLFGTSTTGEVVSEESFFDRLPRGTPYLNISGNTVSFGIGKDVRKFINARLPKDDNESLRQKSLLTDLKGVLESMIFHTSEEMLTGGTAVIPMIQGGVANDVNNGRNGVDFLAKNAWLAYNESINVGTEQEPKWVNTHQPVVLFDIDGVVEDGEIIKTLEEEEEEKAKVATYAKHEKINRLLAARIDDFFNGRGIDRTIAWLRKQTLAKFKVVADILDAEQNNILAKQKDISVKEREAFYAKKSELVESIVKRYLRNGWTIGWEPSTLPGVDHTIFVELPGTDTQISFHGNFADLIPKLETYERGWDGIIGVPLYKLEDWISNESGEENTVPDWSQGINPIIESLSISNEMPPGVDEEWLSKQAAQLDDSMKVVSDLSKYYQNNISSIMEDADGVAKIEKDLQQAKNLMNLFYSGKLDNNEDNLKKARFLARYITELQFYLGLDSDIVGIANNNDQVIASVDGISYMVDQDRNVFRVGGEEVVIQGTDDEMRDAEKLIGDVLRDYDEKRANNFISYLGQIVKWNPFTTKITRDSRVDDPGFDALYSTMERMSMAYYSPYEKEDVVSEEKAKDNGPLKPERKKLAVIKHNKFHSIRLSDDLVSQGATPDGSKTIGFLDVSPTNVLTVDPNKVLAGFKFLDLADVLGLSDKFAYDKQIKEAHLAMLKDDRGYYVTESLTMEDAIRHPIAGPVIRRIMSDMGKSVIHYNLWRNDSGSSKQIDYNEYLIIDKDEFKPTYIPKGKSRSEYKSITRDSREEKSSEEADDQLKLIASKPEEYKYTVSVPGVPVTVYDTVVKDLASRVIQADIEAEKKGKTLTRKDINEIITARRNVLVAMSNDSSVGSKRRRQAKSLDENFKHVMTDVSIHLSRVSSQYEAIYHRDSKDNQSQEEYATISRSYDYNDFQRDPMENVNQSIRKRFSIVPRIITNKEGKSGYASVLKYGSDSSRKYRDSSEVAHEVMGILVGVKNTWTDYSEALTKAKENGSVLAQQILTIFNGESDVVKNGFVRSVNRRFTNLIHARIDAEAQSAWIGRSDFASANSRVVKRWQAKAMSLPIINARSTGNYHINQTVAKEWLDEYESEVLEGEPTAEWTQKHFARIGISLSQQTIQSIMNEAEDFGGNTIRAFTSGGLFGKVAESIKIDIKDANAPMIKYSELFSSNYTRRLASREVNSGEFIPINQRIAGKVVYNFSNPVYSFDQISKIINDPDYRKQLLDSPYAMTSLWLKMLSDENNHGLYKEILKMGEISLEAYRVKNRPSDEKDIQSLTKEEHEYLKLLFFTNSGKRVSDPNNRKGNSRRVSQYFMPTMADRDKILTMTSVAEEMLLENKSGKIRLNSKSIDALFRKIVHPEINAMLAYARVKDLGGSSNIDGYDQGISQFLSIPALNMANGLQNIDGTIDTTKLEDPVVVKEMKEIFRRVIERKIENKISTINDIMPKLYETGLASKRDAQNIGDKSEYELRLDKKYEKHIKDSHGRLIKNAKDYIRVVAIDMVTNYLMFNTEVSQVITSEPAAFFKGLSKEDLAIDLDQAKTTEEKMGILENYYKKNAELTFQNRKKRLADLASSGTKNSSIKLRDGKQVQDLRIAVVQDRIVSSDNIEFLEEIFAGDQEMLDVYRDIISTDGASINITKEHVYYRFDTGNLSEQDVKDLESSISSGVALSPAEVKKYTLNAIKPAIIGNIPQGIGKPTRHLFIKVATTSSPAKIFSDTGAVAIDAILKANNADMLVFASGVKTGSPETVPNIFMWQNGDNFLTDDEYVERGNPIGYVMSNQINPKADLSKGIITVPLDTWYQQQEVPQKFKGDVSVSTQNAKMALVNLPQDFEMDYNGYIPESLSSQFPEENKTEAGHKLNRGQLVDIYEQLWSEIYDNLRDNVISSIAPRGENRRDDMNRLSSMLIEQGRKLNFDINELASLLTKDGNFAVPLWMGPNSSEVQHLLMSMSAKKIIKHKMPGQSFTLASDVGVQKAQGKVISDETMLAKYSNSITFLNDFNGDSLQGKRKVDGKIVPAQVLIPSLITLSDGTQIDMRKYIDADGNIDPNVDQKILDIFGFRIPNAGPNSTLHLRIAGFLPPEMGNIAITTKDVVAQMGSDFDLDKLFSYMYNAYSSGGKVVIFSRKDLKNKSSAREKYDNLRKLYSKKVSSVSHKDRELLLEVLNSSDSDTVEESITTRSQISDLIDDINSTDAEAARIHRRMMYYKKLMDGIVIQQNGIIDINMGIQQVDNQSVQKNIHMPLEYGVFTKGRNEWVESIDSAYKGKSIEEFLFISDDFDTNGFLTAKDNSIGKGLFSSELTLMAQMQILENKGTPLVYFERTSDGGRKPFFFKMAGRISRGNMSEKMTLDGKKERFYEMQNMQSISIDGESMQINERLNFNQKTFEVAASLIKLGWTNGEVSMFLNQPILRMMTSDEAGLNFILSEFGMNSKEEKGYWQSVGNQTPKAMFNNIRQFGGTESGEFSPDFWKNQIIYYKMYQKMDKVSRILSKPRKLVAFDSMNIPNTIIDAMDIVKGLSDNILISVDNIEKLIGDYRTNLGANEINELKKEGFIQIPGTSSVVNPKSVPGNAIIKGIVPTINLWTRDHKLFPFNAGTINMAKSSIATTLGVRSYDIDSNLLVSDMSKFVLSHADVINTLYSNPVNLQMQRQMLIMDDTHASVASVLAHIQGSTDPAIASYVANNPFLRALVPIKGDNTDSASYISLDSNYADNHESNNVLHGGVEDLLKDNETFLADINGTIYTPRELMLEITRSVYVNGQQNNFTNIGKFVPANLISMSGMGDVASSYDWAIVFEQGSGGLSKFALQHIQHNPNAAKLVTTEDIGLTENDSADEIAFIASEKIYTLFSDDIQDGLLPHIVQLVGDQSSRLFMVGDKGNYFPIDTLGQGPISEYSPEADVFGTSVIPANKTAFAYSPGGSNKRTDKPPTMRESRVDKAQDSVKDAEATMETIAKMLSEKLGLPYKVVHRPHLNAKAYYDDGVIYLNSAKDVLLSDVFHEFIHPILGSIKHNNPRLFDRLYAELQNTKEGREAIDKVHRLYNDSQDNNMFVTKEGLLTDLGKDEAIVEALGIMAEAGYSKDNVSEGFWNWVQKMWKSVMDMFRSAASQNVQKEKINPGNLSLDTKLIDIVDMLLDKTSVIYIDSATLRAMEEDLLQPFEFIERTVFPTQDRSNKDQYTLPDIPRELSNAFELVRERRIDDVRKRIKEQIIDKAPVVKGKYKGRKRDSVAKILVNSSKITEYIEKVIRPLLYRSLSQQDASSIEFSGVFNDVKNLIRSSIEVDILKDLRGDYGPNTKVGIEIDSLIDFSESQLESATERVVNQKSSRDEDSSVNLSNVPIIGKDMIKIIDMLKKEAEALYKLRALNSSRIDVNEEPFYNEEDGSVEFINPKKMDFETKGIKALRNIPPDTRIRLDTIAVKNLGKRELEALSKFANTIIESEGINKLPVGEFIDRYKAYLQETSPIYRFSDVEGYPGHVYNRIGPENNNGGGRNAFSGKFNSKSPVHSLSYKVNAAGETKSVAPYWWYLYEIYGDDMFFHEFQSDVLPEVVKGMSIVKDVEKEQYSSSAINKIVSKIFDNHVSVSNESTNRELVIMNRGDVIDSANDAVYDLWYGNMVSMNKNLISEKASRFIGSTSYSASSYALNTARPIIATLNLAYTGNDQYDEVMRVLFKSFMAGDGSLSEDNKEKIEWLSEESAKQLTERELNNFPMGSEDSSIQFPEISNLFNQNIRTMWNELIDANLFNKRANTKSNDFYKFSEAFVAQYVEGLMITDEISTRVYKVDKVPGAADPDFTAGTPPLMKDVVRPLSRTELLKRNSADWDNQKDFHIQLTREKNVNQSEDQYKYPKWLEDLSIEDLILMAEKSSAFEVAKELRLLDAKMREYESDYNSSREEMEKVLISSIMDSLEAYTYRIAPENGKPAVILTKNAKYNYKLFNKTLRGDVKLKRDSVISKRKSSIYRALNSVGLVDSFSEMSSSDKRIFAEEALFGVISDSLRKGYFIYSNNSMEIIDKSLDSVRGLKIRNDSMSSPDYMTNAKNSFISKISKSFDDIKDKARTFNPKEIIDDSLSFNTIYLENSIKDAFNFAKSRGKSYVYLPTTKATMVTQGYRSSWSEDNPTSKFQKGYGTMYGFDEAISKNQETGDLVIKKRGNIHKIAENILGKEGVIDENIPWSNHPLVKYDISEYNSDKILRMSREEKSVMNEDAAQERTTRGELIDMKRAHISSLDDEIAQVNSRKRKIRSKIEKKEKSKGILQMVKGEGSDQAKEWKRLNTQSKVLIASSQKLKQDIDELKKFDGEDPESQINMVGKVSDILNSDFDYIISASEDPDVEIYKVNLSIDLLNKWDKFANILRDDESDAGKVLYHDRETGSVKVSGVRTIVDKMNDYRNTLIKKQNDHLGDLQERFLNRSKDDLLNDMSSDITAMASQFLDISQSGIPIFGLAHAINRNIMSRAMDATREEQEIWDELYSAAKIAAGGEEALYDLISQRDSNQRYTGRIVYPIAQEYFDRTAELKKQAREDKVERGSAWIELSSARGKGGRSAILTAERKYAKSKEKANQSAKKLRKFIAEETHVVNPANLDSQEGIDKEVESLVKVGYSKENAEINIRRAVMRLEDYKAEKEVLSDTVYEEKLSKAYQKGEKEPKLQAEKDTAEQMDRWDKLNSPFAEYERIQDLEKNESLGEDKHDILVQRFLWAAPAMEIDGMPTEWFDPKYQKIQSSPEILEFYSMLQDTLSDFNWHVPASGKNQYRGHTAMPIIGKEVGSLLASDKNPGMISNLVEDIYAGVKSETGARRNYNPYEKSSVSRSSLFSSKSQIDDNVTVAIAKKEGELKRKLEPNEAVEVEKNVINDMINNSTKNLDKTIRPMIQLHNIYKQKSKISDTMRAIEERVEDLEGPETNEFGTFVRSMFNEEVIRDKKMLANAKSQFENFMDVFYGRSRLRKMPKLFTKMKKDMVAHATKVKDDLTQAYLDDNNVDEYDDLPEAVKEELDERKDKLDAIAKKSEKTVTVDDMLKFMMYGVQLKAMGLNISSAIGNYTIGMANNFIEAGKGNLYNEKDMRWGFSQSLMHLTTSTDSSSLTEQGKKIQNIMARYNVIFEKTYYEPLSENNFWRKTMSFAYTPTRVTERMIQGAQMLAMMRNKQITDKAGIEHSLFDALDVNGKLKDEFKTDENLKNWEGDPEDKSQNNGRYLFEAQMTQMIKVTHGNYDPNSPLGMDREIILRMMATFKKWFFTNFNNRWGKEYEDTYLGTMKGRYRTGFLLYARKGARPGGEDGWSRQKSLMFGINQLLRKLVGSSTQFDEAGFSKVDAQNMRANLNEMISIIMINLAMLLLSAIAGGDDDDKEKKTVAYYFMMNKLNSLNRDVTMWWNPMELGNLMKDPIPVFNLAYQISDLLGTTTAALWTQEWEYETGIYAHQNKVWVKGRKLTPLLTQYYKLQDLGSKIF